MKAVRATYISGSGEVVVERNGIATANGRICPNDERAASKSRTFSRPPAGITFVRLTTAHNESRM